jgi:hypothetical protein
MVTDQAISAVICAHVIAANPYRTLHADDGFEMTVIADMRNKNRREHFRVIPAGPARRPRYDFRRRHSGKGYSSLLLQTQSTEPRRPATAVYSAARRSLFRDFYRLPRQALDHTF